MKTSYQYFNKLSINSELIHTHFTPLRFAKRVLPIASSKLPYHFSLSFIRNFPIN
jgi:hypothetical protein